MVRTTLDLPHTAPTEAARGGRPSRHGAPSLRLTILEESSAEKKRRWRSLLVSASCQLVCLLAAVYLGILLNIIRPPEPLQVVRAFLYIPKGPNPEPPPPKPAPPPKRVMETEQFRLKAVVEPPKMTLPPPPVVKTVLPPMNIPAPPPLKAPKPDVVEGTFSKAAPAEPPKKPQGTVTSASFGAPASAPASHGSSQPVSVGGFGIGGTPQRGRLMLPQGGGINHPVGFGDASGGGGGTRSGRRPGTGSVQVGGSGFDSTLYASAAANPSGPRRPEPPPTTIPVEILFKPKPEYTEAARRERIEGEVLLEALFTATGRVTNIRVVQGLGHGLDEMALKAAQQIQFKPAKKNGEPADSIASIRIVFKLAY